MEQNEYMVLNFKRQELLLHFALLGGISSRSCLDNKTRLECRGVTEYYRLAFRPSGPQVVFGPGGVSTWSIAGDCSCGPQAGADRQAGRLRGAAIVGDTFSLILSNSK